MSDPNVSDILNQIRILSKQAGFETPPTDTVGKSAEQNSIDFSSALKQSLDEVNQIQKSAGKLAEGFEKGDPNVELSEVMIEMQKARVSFEALSQVRNKLITAYQEIMNMQI